MLNWKKISKIYSDRALLILVTLAYLTVVPVTSQFTCNNDAECGGNQCCSTYGYCGVGPDYCRAGCVLEDTEILGGDLTKEENGLGFVAQQDDDCSLECEKNKECQFWTFDIREKLCYLKFGRGSLRPAVKGTFISGSTRDNGCVPDPPCKPPKKKIDGVCKEPAVEPEAVPKPPTIPTLEPEAESEPILPEPPMPTFPPKVFAPLPTLPPKVVEETFITPPVITDSFQGAYDYCSGLGGVLPSFNFFDVFNNINETPRKSFNSTNTTKETEAGSRPFVSSNRNFGYDSSEFEVDTSVDFVNQKLEETPQGTRSKRQIYPRYPLSYYGTRGHWYWINNYNDGKTCYAALPGDRVRFRGFSCTDLLRVICQKSSTDRTPLLTSKPATANQIANQIERAKEPLTNQVPEAVIRSNPKKPLFQLSGITNPYLNYHSKLAEKRRQQQRKKSIRLYIPTRTRYRHRNKPTYVYQRRKTLRRPPPPRYLTPPKYF